MERIEMIERAAGALLAQCHVASVLGAERIERIREALGLYIQPCPASGVMLGGAYSRLQLFAWDRPEVGGMIWLADDLDAEKRLFALAHELGHYVLHRGEGVNLHTACDQQAIDPQADPAGLRAEDHVVQEYSPRVRRELEASAFAAELLAPRAEVRRLFTTVPHMDAARLAHRLGVSPTLAARRLIDALLAPGRPVDYERTGPQASGDDDGTAPAPGDLLARLDESQRAAARAQGPTLVMAGPGTGKTATLVGRVAYLVGERHVQPEHVLALTFSNRAAGEMRERLERSGLPGERMPVMTIHAFAATLLREYASRVPHAPDEAELRSDFHILDEANAFLLMEGLLGELPLRYYRSLGNPTAHVNTLRNDFSQARDELLTPDDYHTLVDAMRLAPDDDEPDKRNGAKNGRGKRSTLPDGLFTREEKARASERARAYAVWDRALRRRGLVDFGGLVQRAAELLRTDSQALASVRARYPQMLVDEFQDTNRAAAELLMLVAGERGDGLWVVGDQNQSIYRFRGASPDNLRRLTERYPQLRVLTLRRCYRAVPAIVHLGSAMAAQMAQLAPAAGIAEEPAGALAQVMRPVELEAVRPDGPDGPDAPDAPDGAQPAIQRAEDFASAAHERLGLAAAIARFHALGYHYGDQAILCRNHKQERAITATLAQQGVPVSQLGDFFERPEIKDALMLLYLATGPDARGVLRAAPLLACLGFPPPAAGELAATTRMLSSQRHPLPAALRDQRLLGQIAGLSAATRAHLAELGQRASEVRASAKVGSRLAEFLLRPGGYAWRLARVSDGLDASATGGALAGLESPARAQQALAALGELVRLAWRFDLRWESDPEFQERMRRISARRRATHPPAPDTLQGAPGADVADGAGAADTRVSSPDVAESTPVVACFLRYLQALRSTEAVVPVLAGEEDAVHVLTLHQSKGLEFPVVLLPGLAKGQFPNDRPPREEVCPPGFRPGATPSEREAEERCLFYVGLTRARDVVAITRATSYGKPSTRNARTAEPSRLLALLTDAPEWVGAPPLLPDAERARLRAIAEADEESDEDERDEEAEAAPALADTMRATGDAPERKPYRLHELEEYLTCPRKYKYASQYHLLDPAQNAVYRFHRFIRRGARELRDTRAATPNADWQAVEARLRPLWETEGPAGHAYDAFYWQAAEAILREEWQAITEPGSRASDRVTLAEELVAHLRYCDVEVTADRVIDGESGLVILMRLHTGRPRADDEKDLTLPLYYLAYRRAHPEAHLEIVLAYTGAALADGERDENEAGEEQPTSAYDPRNQEFVTEVAEKAAEKYLDATRKARSALDKLDEAALGIQSGEFPPRPDEHRCAACPYCYVCPADPESSTPDTIPVRPATQLLESAESSN